MATELRLRLLFFVWLLARGGRDAGRPLLRCLLCSRLLSHAGMLEGGCSCGGAGLHDAAGCARCCKQAAGRVLFWGCRVAAAASSARWVWRHGVPTHAHTPGAKGRGSDGQA